LDYTPYFPWHWVIKGVDVGEYITTWYSIAPQDYLRGCTIYRLQTWRASVTVLRGWFFSSFSVGKP
jgi:hypothetical protein